MKNHSTINLLGGSIRYWGGVESDCRINTKNYYHDRIYNTSSARKRLVLHPQRHLTWCASWSGTGFYSPDKEYEGLSFTQGVYFGVDTKKGTMLYARAYPGNIMDIIGFDIDNFTRTVTDAKTLEIYTKYINIPMVSIPSGCIHPKMMADTMHAMAERGYDYPVDFPRLIQEKRKEWEQIAGMPVAEVF